MDRKKYNERYEEKYCNKCQDIRKHFKKSGICCGCQANKIRRSVEPKRCCDCDKIINQYGTRCVACDTKRRKEEALLNFKPNLCQDCKKEISVGSIRCLSCANRVRIFTQKTKDKIRAKAIGRKHTEESKKKISISGKGRVFSDEHKLKIGQSNKGKVVSQSTRIKLSESKKGKPSPNPFKKGHIPWNKGMRGVFHHSELSKQKISKATSWKNNPNFIDGRGTLRYNKIFNNLREYILERDNFTCQICNMTQKEHFLIYNRNIEVHHIDYNKLNNNENNLICLCKGCNLKLNNKKIKLYWQAVLSIKVVPLLIYKKEK